MGSKIRLIDFGAYPNPGDGKPLAITARSADDGARVAIGVSFLDALADKLGIPTEQRRR